MKQQNKGWRIALLLVGLGLVAYLVMDFNSRMADIRRLSEQREGVRVQGTAVMATQQALEAQLVYATSEAAVQEWAYEDGHLVRPGDVPVVPVASGGTTVTPTPTPLPAPTETSPWKAWWALFLGPQDP